jgi:signal transduction histidine kinase
MATRSQVSFAPSDERISLVRELCHDLRQPVATIAALAEVALGSDDMSEETRRRLLQIREEAAAMATLVRRVLDDALHFEPVDVDALLRDVARSFEVTHRVPLPVEGHSGLMVVGDRVALRRAVANLVDNAVRAAGPSGTVALVAGQRDGWVHLEVHDSGRASGDGRGAAPGAGLGLGIVARITRAHGGDLAFGRSSLGGTLARMRLPAARHQAGATGNGRPRGSASVAR